MIPQDDSHENEFERAEHLVDIHLPHSNKDFTLISKRYQITINEEEEDVGYKKPDFLQANPILPPDKHTIREEPAFRLKFMSQREKFNKTSFSQIAVNPFNRKNKLSSLSVNETTNNKNKILSSPEQLDEDEQQEQEMKGILEHKIVVYRRYNFNKYNTLGKEKVLCSLFLQHRKEHHSSKTQPIYEYLTKINNTKNAKINNGQWLTFNSSFQSGNALMIVLDPRQAMPTYEVYMQNDVNTRGCTQWFYFSVENKSKGKAKFCLTNFYKPTSLYQRGMKVLCSQDGIEWKRTGTAITYSKSSQQKNTYGLSFIHDFDQPSKTTYFAYGYPYTYSNHFSSYIQNIFSDQRFLKIVHKTNLCYSAMGNPIPILTITCACTSSKKETKQLIYIIGRQHPGETPASFIVQGLISFLLSSTQEAKDLRERFQFKIVPMVNVDGVISGNYRSNISGSDVNRQWQFPSKRSHPEINAIKQQIANNRKQVAFFLDIHAHSRKMNSFFYGSKASSRESKLYSFVCSKLNKFISCTESSFTDDPSKKTTARVILETELQIPHSLTFQVSFYGYHDMLKGSNYSFKQVDLRMIGESLGLGFYYFFIGIDKVRKNEEIKNSTLPKFISEKEKNLYKNSLKMLQKWNKELQKQNQIDQVYSEGSQIDPQHFQLKQEERQFISQLTQKSTILQNDEENSKRCLSTPKEQKYRNSRKIIYSSLSPQIHDSKLLMPKGESKQHLGISSNEFYHFSQSRKDKKFSVKQLELQLQLSSQPSVHEQKLRGMRLKMGNPVTLDRQILLESFRSERQKNYKEDILQMKKALKYLLQSKSSDYNEYKACFKSFTNELMSTTLRQNRRVNKL